MNTQKIKDIVGEHLAGTNMFLVSLTISTHNHIRVFIDGDDGVRVADCIALSRYIESRLDRDNEDFNLEVSSVGVGQPLVMTRQYRNNTGRRLAINAKDDRQVKGKLVETTDEGIWLEPDPEKKKKKSKKDIHTESESKVFILYEDILEAKVQVSFK